jgi:hypothetical protein
MINRLQYELQSRQDLLKQLDELTNQKTSLESANQQKQEFLIGLRENLKSYGAVNKKLSQFMQMEEKKTEDFDSARVLPTPLYILYNNMLSYQLHFGNYELLSLLICEQINRLNSIWLVM